MMQPLVAKHGAAWLARGIADVIFVKPAYDGDLLTARAPGMDLPIADSVMRSLAATQHGVELARMTAQLRESPPAIDARAAVPPAPTRDKQLVSWDLMEAGVPFPALAWTPTQAENLEWCTDVRDELPVYREGAFPLLHPGLILRQANLVLRNRFTLPAWIHTGSRIVFHAAARAGETFEVRAIPEEKWQQKRA